MATADASFNVRDHGTALRRKNRVQCNYCGKDMSGFYRLKYHLGGIRGDVKPCKKVPENVKEFFGNTLLETMKGSLMNEVGELHRPNRSQKRNACSNLNGIKSIKRGAAQNANWENGGPQDTERQVEGETQHVSIPTRRIGSLAGSDAGKKQDALSRQTQKCIGRFFYETGIDLSVANLTSLRNMINATLCHTQGRYEIPSCDELKGLTLEEEVTEMRKRVERIRHSWASTGCSILLDGWVDQNGRNLVNFIVDCPQGPIYLQSSDVSAVIGDVDALQLLLDGVITEVGADNVVQIIASSTTGWMGQVGKQFMERPSTVFWTVSASHCIELVLEKISEMGHVRGILDRAKTITRFIYGHEAVLGLFKCFSGGSELIKPCKVSSATPFMTLENIVLKKENLMAMFTSSRWEDSSWKYGTWGNKVVNQVKDSAFWSEVMTVVKAAIPLVNVLVWINRADTPQVGYIYETMDQVKETISEEFKTRPSFYRPIWKVIDEIWDSHLHSPLHIGGYYLNPSLFYSEFYWDPEVETGWSNCIRRMQDQQTRDKVSLQLDKYVLAQDDFSKGSKKEEINKYHPAEWWLRYGNQCPELQKYATRILSQTCGGASKYGLKRGLSEKLLADGMNRIEQRHLSKLAFVYYNLQLQKFQLEGGGGIVADEIDPMDDWIV